MTTLEQDSLIAEAVNLEKPVDMFGILLEATKSMATLLDRDGGDDVE